jgi:hypothetical protein
MHGVLCTYCTLTVNLDLINSPLCNSKAAVVELNYGCLKTAVVGSVNRALKFDRLKFDRPDGPGLTIRIGHIVRGPENGRRKIPSTKCGASARRSHGRRGSTLWFFWNKSARSADLRVFQSVGCRALGCVVPRGFRNTPQVAPGEHRTVGAATQ